MKLALNMKMVFNKLNKTKYANPNLLKQTKHSIPNLPNQTY